MAFEPKVDWSDYYRKQFEGKYKLPTTSQGEEMVYELGSQIISLLMKFLDPKSERNETILREVKSYPFSILELVSEKVMSFYGKQIETNGTHTWMTYTLPSLTTSLKNLMTPEELENILEEVDWEKMKETLHNDWTSLIKGKPKFRWGETIKKHTSENGIDWRTIIPSLEITIVADDNNSLPF